MRYTINIPPDIESRLQERARASGTPADIYIQDLVQSALARPTLHEVLAPIHQDFLASGMTEDELNSILTQAIDESRRHRRRAS